MGTPSPPGAPRPTFSPDGLWFWDGAAWKPAMSPDGRWRWDGSTWQPAQPAAAPGGRGATTAVILTVAAFGGVLVLVAIATLVILLTMGNQLANVFSNVAAALGSSPSP